MATTALSPTDYSAATYKKKHEFILAHINPKPSIEGVYFPPSSCFRNDDVTFDPETKMLRTIRYVPGEKSIFVDEQTPDDVVKKVATTIEFVNGKKIVEERESNLHKFLMMHSRNGSNPNRDTNQSPLFWLYEPKKAFEGIIEMEQDKAKAKHWCFTSDWGNIRTLARAMNLPVEGIDAAEVRYTLSTYADQDAAKFISAMKNPAMHRKAMIYDAVDRGMIKIDKVNRTVEWTSGGVIIHAPIGKDPIDHLTETTFTAEGDAFFSGLKEQLYPSIAPQPAEKPVLGTSPAEDKFKLFIKECIDFDILQQDGAWYSSKKFSDLKALGMKKLQEYLTPDKIADLETMLEKAKAGEEY